jgi:hypothetical protein
MTDERHAPPLPGGKLSRRGLLRSALALFGAIGISVKARSAMQRGAVPKAIAKYQDRPNGPQHCAICVNFAPPSSCHVVSGKISPNGWCQFFTPKAPGS